MKKLILILSLLALAILPSRAVKKIEANPINVAFILSQQTDPAKMASILDYYGYQQAPTTDGYAVYTHGGNGSTIRFTFQDATTGQPFPDVEVKSKASTKTEAAILEDLQFKKDGSGYVRKRNQNARTAVTCTHAPNGFLLFHQLRIAPQPLK